MNEQLIREVLDEQADQGMPVPGAQDLWPSVHERIRSRERTRSVIPLQTSKTRPVGLLKPALAAGVVVILIALGTMSWLAQPAPVDAAEILARSEQAASVPGVKSFHGVWSSRVRNEATAPFFEAHHESWYLAPDSSRSEGRTVGNDGEEETSLLVRDGKMIWLYLSGDSGHSGHNQVILKDEDATIPVFGASDLGSLTGRGWLGTWYDPKLVGTDEILGRHAYVLDFTLKPEDQWPANSWPSQRARMKYWIDQQAYFVLKTTSWDVNGNELMDGGFTDFQIDAAMAPSIFSFTPPEGAQILDTRIAGADELNTLWKQASQQAPFNLYRPTNWLSAAREGRPYYDTRQGVLTQAFPRANPRDTNSFEVQVPVITQKRASNKDLQGNGPPVKVGNLTGIYATNESLQTLTVVRDGTEITLSLPVIQGGIDMTERMVQMLASLELVQK